MKIWIDAVSVVAPGLNGWGASVPVLSAQQPYIAVELERYKPTKLPANEARRATELVRMAFRVAEDLTANTAFDLSQCFNVFASSGGDYPIIDQICRALCEPERLVSPTQFHNSVHNSAAGYWSIATGNQLASTSISAHDDSFIMGLLEAATMTVSEQRASLLVCYDIKPPQPLKQKRPIEFPFGMAFLIQPQKTAHSIASVELLMDSVNLSETLMLSDALEILRKDNPAARSLPVLALLAAGQSGAVGIARAVGGCAGLEVTAC